MFLAGLAVFFALHTLPFLPEKRAMVIARVGDEGLYRVLFIVVSIIALLFAGLGKGRFPFIELWPTPGFFRLLSVPVIYVATVLILSAYLPSNIPRYVPHPMLIGIIVWAGMHMLSNGDLGSLVLFGSFLGYSIWAMKQSDLREQEQEEAARTLPLWRDGIVLAIAAVIFLLLAGMHQAFFGRAIFA